MAYTQTTKNDVRNDASATTLALAAFNAVAGRTIVVEVSWETTNTTVTLSDTAGNTYSSPAELKKKSGANNQWVQVFYVTSCLGNAANVLTATWASAADFRGMAHASYSYSGTSTYDNGGNGDAPTSLTLAMLMTPTGTGSNLLFTATKSFNANNFATPFAPGWNFVTSTNGPTELNHCEDQIVTGTTPINGGALATGVSNITGVYAIFKETTGGGGGAGSCNRLLLGVG